MRRVLIPAALALVALAAVATLKLTLTDAYTAGAVYIQGLSPAEVLAEYNNAPRGAWLGPYNETIIAPVGGRSLVFYIAFLNVPAGDWYVIMLNGWHSVYINYTVTHAESSAYKITLVAQNSTHYIYRVEVKIPDVNYIDIMIAIGPEQTAPPAKTGMWVKIP